MALKLDDYRLLGRSGVRVSPLCLGTMTFGVEPGAWGCTDRGGRAAGRPLHRPEAAISSIPRISTGNWASRKSLLGQAVKGRRDRLVISTKYSLTTSPGDPNASGNHRKNMVRSVEDSLKRMKTDYIDLYYLHMWDFRTPVDEILRAFDDLVRAGKILYIGLSDIPAWQASRMQAIAELRGWSQFCALQISYSLTERTVEREMIPMAAEMGMGVCPWSPLGGGVLAGKYSKADLVPPDMNNLGSRKAINAITGRLSEHNLAVAEVVGEIAQEAR